MRKLALFALIPVAAVAGCASQQLPAEVVTVMETTTVTETAHATAPETANATAPVAHVNLRCDAREITVDVFAGNDPMTTDGDYIDAVIDGQPMRLPRALAASGERYVMGDTTIWNHHDDWMFILNEGMDNEEWIECTVQ